MIASGYNISPPAIVNDRLRQKQAEVYVNFKLSSRKDKVHSLRLLKMTTAIMPETCRRTELNLQA
ncbi:MAG: hypothetical protein AABZ36_01575, partial [Nitrospirota bacterium]